MKLIKVQFTSWRDKEVAPRPKAFQEKLDTWTMRENALSAAAATIKVEQTEADTEVLQKSLARINAELRQIDAERTFLLSAEEAAADAEAHEATQHPKVGTFGFLVLSEPGKRVGMIVDETGKFLQAQALYTYDVVDEDPPLPQWVKDGKYGG